MPTSALDIKVRKKNTSSYQLWLFIGICAYSLGMIVLSEFSEKNIKPAFLGDSIKFLIQKGSNTPEEIYNDIMQPIQENKDSRQAMSIFLMLPILGMCIVGIIFSFVCFANDSSPKAIAVLQSFCFLLAGVFPFFYILFVPYEEYYFNSPILKELSRQIANQDGEVSISFITNYFSNIPHHFNMGALFPYIVTCAFGGVGILFQIFWKKIKSREIKESKQTLVN